MVDVGLPGPMAGFYIVKEFISTSSFTVVIFAIMQSAVHRITRNIEDLNIISSSIIT